VSASAVESVSRGKCGRGGTSKGRFRGLPRWGELWEEAEKRRGVNCQERRADYDRCRRFPSSFDVPGKETNLKFSRSLSLSLSRGSSTFQILFTSLNVSQFSLYSSSFIFFPRVSLGSQKACLTPQKVQKSGKEEVFPLLFGRSYFGH
jgi:hypothetical protein